MSLKLGELATILTLDSKKFDEGLDGSETALQKWGQRATNAGGAIGAGIATAAAAGLLGALQLGPVQAKIKNQLGDPAAAKAAGEAAAAAYGRGFGATLEEAMTASATIISSGLSGGSKDAKVLEDLTVKAQALANTFEFDLAKATSVAGVMMRDGLAKNGTEALDLIAAASRRVAPEFREDLLDAAHEYGQFFHMIGMNGPQAFEMLARGAEQGMYGIDKTGDAIKEFGIRATDMSKSTETAFGSIGLEAHEMANELLAGGDTARAAFDKTINGLLGMKDPALQAEAALALFGTPLEDLSVSEIPAFLQSLSGVGAGMKDVAGTSKEMADTFEQDAQQQLIALKNEIEVALIKKLGEAVPVIQSVVSWLKEHKAVADPLVTTMLAFAAAVGTAKVAMIAYQGALVTATAAKTTWRGITIAASASMTTFTAATNTARVAVLLTSTAFTAAGAQVTILTAALWAKVAALGASAAAWASQAALAAANTVRLVAYLAMQGAIAVATGVWTAAQWLLNLALNANPVGLIIMGIMLLIGIIILIATKTTWFQDLWKVVWDGIKSAASAVGSWFMDTLWGKWIKGAWDAIVAAGASAVDWFKSIPGNIKSAFSSLVSIITSPFKSAFNAVAGLWNRTVGNLSFTAPSWVPGIGGKGFSLPKIPMLAKGGDIMRAGMAIVGEKGPELLNLDRGAQVQPLKGGSTPVASARQHISGTILLKGDGILSGLREYIDINGGEVQAVLGTS